MDGTGSAPVMADSCFTVFLQQRLYATAALT